jgi:hypothetical protein
MVLPSNSIIHCRRQCKFWVMHNGKRLKFLTLHIGQRWFFLCLHNKRWWHCVCKKWMCKRSKVAGGDVAINTHDVSWLLMTNENRPSHKWWWNLSVSLMYDDKFKFCNLNFLQGCHMGLKKIATLWDFAQRKNPIVIWKVKLFKL